MLSTAFAVASAIVSTHATLSTSTSPPPSPPLLVNEARPPNTHHPPWATRTARRHRATVAAAMAIMGASPSVALLTTTALRSIAQKSAFPSIHRQVPPHLVSRPSSHHLVRNSSTAPGRITGATVVGVDGSTAVNHFAACQSRPTLAKSYVTKTARPPLSNSQA